MEPQQYDASNFVLPMVARQAGHLPLATSVPSHSEEKKIFDLPHCQEPRRSLHGEVGLRPSVQKIAT